MENRIITINQPLGDPTCPYCYRTVLNLGLFAIRYHKWVGNDDLRNKHDHPYSFITIILTGSYNDVTTNPITKEDKEETLTPWSIRYRKSTHTHSVKLNTKICRTLVISGPPLRQWGFWVNGKFIRREKYFKKYGHQCDQ